MISAAEPGPRLDWGPLAAFDPDGAGPLPTDLARIRQLAAESLDLVAGPIARFELAGTLNGHPRHVCSDEAKRDSPAIFALAVAGRAAEESLRTHSRITAASASSSATPCTTTSPPCIRSSRRRCARRTWSTPPPAPRSPRV